MRPRDAREKVSAEPPHLAPKQPVELPLGVQRICVVLPVEEQVNQEDLGDDVPNNDVPGDKVPGDDVPGNDEPGDDVPGQAETEEEPTDELLGFVEPYDAAVQQIPEQPPDLEDELYSI